MAPHRVRQRALGIASRPECVTRSSCSGEVWWLGWGVKPSQADCRTWVPIRSPAAPNPRKDCPELGGQTEQRIRLHPGSGAEPHIVRTARAWMEEPSSLHASAPTLRAAWWPTCLGLGKVSLKKVGSQERRMKKEQAAESWEAMAALGAAPRLSIHTWSRPHTRVARG